MEQLFSFLDPLILGVSRGQELELERRLKIQASRSSATKDGCSAGMPSGLGIDTQQSKEII